MTLSYKCAVLCCFLIVAAQSVYSQDGASAPTTVAVNGDYKLLVNDVVSLQVFQEPELSCVERIASDGTISVPLVGRIRIAGMNPVAASNTIRGALQADYLVNPQVSLSVTEATKQFFTLLGEVKNPGTYVVPPNQSLDLLQAIGIGGGFTRLAAPGRITVSRKMGGEEKVFKVDAEKLASDRSKNRFEVLPGDVVTVKERVF